MDEQQFYIENCLPGIWDNKDISISIQLGTPNLITITDKTKAPNSGSEATYHVVKQDWYYVLRIIVSDGTKVGALDYKIDHIDCATGDLTISAEGATWELKKVVEF